MQKTLLITVFTFVFASLLFSQTCQTFDEQVVATANKEHAFNTYGNGNAGFLQDWRVISGTPAVYQSGALSGVSAFEGNQYALFTVCDAGAMYSESVSLDYNFVQGQSYTVSMAIRNAPLPPNSSTPIDIEYVLLQAPVAYTYNTGTGCSPTPAVPGSATVAHTISSFSQNSWQTVSFTISNLTANYTQLWIRPKFSAGAPLTTTFLCMDSFCIQPQTVELCQTFDEQVVATANKEHAFNTYGNGNAGFLQDWRVISGTPAVYQSGALSGVSAFEGNQYALFTVCDAGAMYSESVSLDYNFVQGQSYKVSMAIRNAPLPPNSSTPIDIEYVLLQAPVAYTYNSSTGCSTTPAIPGSATVAHTISSFSQNSWQTVSFTISNLTANYTQLWIRPKFSAGAPLTTTFLCMDSFCLKGETATGIEPVKSANPESIVSPNPFSEKAIIKVNGQGGIQQVEVMDMNGRLIKKLLAAGAPDIEITKEGMVPGLYFYTLLTTENKRAFGRLIVE